MREAPWRHCLSLPYGKSQRSYGDRFPVEAAAILEGILRGVPIDFIGDRSVARFGRNPLISDEIAAKVDQVIAEDVRTLKKAGPLAQAPFAVMSISPIGAVPKRNSVKVRVIHNLSFPFGGDSVNANIRVVPFDLSSFGVTAGVSGIMSAHIHLRLSGSDLRIGLLFRREK